MDTNVKWDPPRGVHGASGPGGPLTNAGFVDGLAGDRGFREAFADHLRTAPGAAYCWETPRWTRAALTEPFRCALVDSPALARALADPGPFREHFSDAASVAFPSLGGDALLLAPCPRGADPAPYAHLARFVRGPARPG